MKEVPGMSEGKDKKLEAGSSISFFRSSVLFQQAQSEILLPGIVPRASLFSPFLSLTHCIASCRCGADPEDEDAILPIFVSPASSTRLGSCRGPTIDM